ncbi:MAG: glycosyltransferase family 2 protein [Anaerolineae bacterium]
MSRAPSVGVIILNWNNAPDTLACLESVLHSDYPNFHVLVVDNGSTDGSSEAVRAAYPTVTLIENGENLGYAEGNNVGIRHALAEGADYVLLLNNDTLVAPDMLRELIAVAETDARVGIVGPLIYYYEPADVLWNAGNAIDWRNGSVANLYGDKPAVGVGTQPYAVDYVSGCALCIRRQVIEQVGILDSRFFIYYEETDWCVRARRAGYQVLMVPCARIWHKVSGTMGIASPPTTYYMTRNQFLFYARHTRGLARTTLLSRLLLRELRTLAAHSLKPCHHHLRRSRDARLLALRDALLGRWGKMGADVARVCYPRTI